MDSLKRQQARDIFAAGVAAADPYKAVVAALDSKPVLPAKKTLILALGKAAMGMAEAAQPEFGDVETIIITNSKNAHPVDFATVFTAGHPIPDQDGERAAHHVIKALHALGPDDQLLALISGGGSAMLPAPVDGISLKDKAEVNKLLLSCGADIAEMNLVRQQLSNLKGGGMLRVASPAKVRGLILSDVIGDDLRVVASGPTVGAVGTRTQAVELLKSYEIWGKLPEAVKQYLTKPAPEFPEELRAENQLIGSNQISLQAMSDHAAQAVMHPEPLIGGVVQAAETVIKSGAGITLFGGEVTVKLTGTGLGGRGQELALRMALLAEKQGWPRGWVFLSGGTDGRDGPTDAAGGIVDAGSLKRMRAAGLSPEKMLANNDSYHALKAADDLLITGATGTNVADLQILIREWR